jgi:hypothetical protein
MASMNRISLIAALGAIALAGISVAQTNPQSPPFAGPNGATMGPGMMGRSGAGPGMMTGAGGAMAGGQGMMGGGGMMGCGRQGTAGKLDLQVGDVTACMERRLAIMANPHVKLGPVSATSADVITADIVTVDNGGLADRLAFDRHTGRVRRAAN